MSTPELFPTPELAQLVALDKAERLAHPNIVFEYAGTSPADELAMSVALEALQLAGQPVIGDIMTDRKTRVSQAIIRTTELDRFALRTVGALTQGATSVARNAIEQSPLDATRAITQSAVQQITENPDLSKAFHSFYAGLGWSTDQEKFTSELFRFGTEFNLDELSDHIDQVNKYHLMDMLDDIMPEDSVSDKFDLYDLTTDELLARFPQLDYRQLEDPVFAASPEGQRLTAAYTVVLGKIQVAAHDSRHRLNIDKDGQRIEPPLIPLSKFPLIEALVVDEVAMMKPTAKYNFGRSEVSAIALGSDSLPALQALVTNATTRLPEKDRHVFDGPDEFTQKFRVTSDVAATYRAEKDPTRRAQLKDMVFTILDAYTGDGVIASEIREEDRLTRDRGSQYNPEVSEIKDIVTNILIKGLSSADAEEFMWRALPEQVTTLTLRAEPDPLALTQTDRIILLLDALAVTDGTSHPQVFELLGRKFFESDEIGQTLRQIAEWEIEGNHLFDVPSVLLARKALGRISLSLGGKEETEELAIRENLDRATAPGEELFARARAATDTLLLDCIERMIDDGLLVAPNRAHSQLFDAFVKRISYGSMWDAKALPANYAGLTTLANRPELHPDYRATIVWKLAEAAQHAGKELQPLLPDALIDGYRILLGEPESVQLPDRSVSHGLGALRHLAYKNRNMFGFASEEQLQVLVSYHQAIAELAGQFFAVNDTTSERARDLESALRDLQAIEGQYKQYLYFERVKLEPAVFYPWVLDELAPFWYDMRREASPDYSPTPEIRQLFAVLKDFVENKAVRREDAYPQDFDVIADGKIDVLMLEGYQRMVTQHHMGYNTTVWQKGLPFMSYVASMMPASVVEQFRAKYGDQSGLVQYIQNVRKRYSDDEK